MRSRPKAVNICGVPYKIAYVKRPADVDPTGRQPAWGQIDHWAHTIRVYDGGISEDVFQTLMHEIIHGVSEALHLKSLNEEENHDELDVLAIGLADVLIRNGWVKLEAD